MRRLFAFVFVASLLSLFVFFPGRLSVPPPIEVVSGEENDSITNEGEDDFVASEQISWEKIGIENPNVSVNELRKSEKKNNQIASNVNLKQSEKGNNSNVVSPDSKLVPDLNSTLLNYLNNSNISRPFRLLYICQALQQICPLLGHGGAEANFQAEISGIIQNKFDAKKFELHVIIVKRDPNTISNYSNLQLDKKFIWEVPKMEENAWMAHIEKNVFPKLPEIDYIWCNSERCPNSFSKNRFENAPLSTTMHYGSGTRFDIRNFPNVKYRMPSHYSFSTLPPNLNRCHLSSIRHLKTAISNSPKKRENFFCGLRAVAGNMAKD